MVRIVLILLILQLPALLNAQPFIQILGVAQDGGYPHIGCKKKCCTQAWSDPANKKYVVSFAVVDPETRQWWLFEATPDIKNQLQYFNELTGGSYKYLPDGIFITHAHIGHYTGLMQLGREALGAKNVPVYVLPKMKSFLENNGPWQQLVRLQNIKIEPIQPNSITGLNSNTRVQAFTVPHRDEYSETSGFTIIAGKKKYLFVPDIDKWSKWDKNIIKEVSKVDIALLDATFYSADELPGRRMEEVPHPFVAETMELFSKESESTKAKIHFIHMNHTNPLLRDEEQRKKVMQAGYNIAVQGMKL
ncbi:MAG: pyrroloquinoline quinone biosynthesis protein PqqB [Taibaiella sp.]|nr:pyrroloquinoline quinone biosynthesis protein PqqB [Taibaiella sp.]